MSQFVSG